MKTKSYILAGIIAVITMGNAMATDENTVTSKSYVDAMDATKQDKITAKTTGNVVTYNGTENGQTKFDEVGIYNGGAQYNASTDSGKLITAGTVANMATAIESITIPDNKLVGVDENGASNCQINNSCTLWRISTGTTVLTPQGTLAPLTEACKAYGDAITTSQSECCSGQKRPCSKGQTCYCGCNTVTDCPSGSTSCSTTTHTCS